MSLNLDARNNAFSTTHSRSKDGHESIKATSAADTPPLPKYEQQLQDNRVGGLRRTVMYLSIALGLAVVLCAVAAGVGGSLAAQREVSYNECEANVQEWSQLYIKSDAFSCIVNGTNLDANSSTFHGFSNCANLSSPYIPPTFRRAFDIHCDTDFPSPSDIMAIMVYTFEDCVSACSSYNERNPNLHSNSTCYTASFNEGVTGAGPSCFLKGSQNITAQSRPGIFSSAVLVTK